MPKNAPQTQSAQPSQPGVEQWRPLVAKYFPADQVDNALAVMGAESSGLADATCNNTNGSIDRGLFQINSVHSGRVAGNLDSLYDPETNVRIAGEIFSGQGWHPWVAAHKLGLAGS